MGDELELNYYWLQKISEGSISLKEGKGDPLKGPRDAGTGNGEDESILRQP